MSDNDPMQLKMPVYEMRQKKALAEEVIGALLDALVKECGYHVDVVGLNLDSDYTLVYGRKAQLHIQATIEMRVL